MKPFTRSNAKRIKTHHTCSSQTASSLLNAKMIESQASQTTQIHWNPTYSLYIDYLMKWARPPRFTKGKMARLMTVQLFEDRVQSIQEGWEFETMETDKIELELLAELCGSDRSTLGSVMANAFMIVVLVAREEDETLVDADTVKAFGKAVEKIYKVQWMQEIIPHLVKL